MFFEVYEVGCEEEAVLKRQKSWTLNSLSRSRVQDTMSFLGTHTWVDGFYTNVSFSSAFPEFSIILGHQKQIIMSKESYTLSISKTN